MKDSWLTPNGEIIEVGKANHNDYAKQLLEKEHGKEYWQFMDELESDYPYQVLCKRGWIRIQINDSYLPKIKFHGDCIDLTKPMRNTMCPAMNERQLRVAKELCEKYETEFHVAINNKRFW